MPSSGRASALPPFSALTLSPAFHWGIGATRQSPEADFAPDSRLAGIQAPVASVAMLPSPRPLYHSSVQAGTEASSFSSMSCCQVSVNVLAPWSEKSIFTLVPSTV